MSLLRNTGMEEVDPPSISEHKQGGNVYEEKLARVRTRAWQAVQELAEEDDEHFPSNLRSLYEQLRAVKDYLLNPQDLLNAFMFAPWVKRVLGLHLLKTDTAERLRQTVGIDPVHTDEPPVPTLSHFLAVFARCGFIPGEDAMEDINLYFFDGEMCQFEFDQNRLINVPAYNVDLFDHWHHMQLQLFKTFGNVPVHMRLRANSDLDDYHAPQWQKEAYRLPVMFGPIQSIHLLTPGALNVFDFINTIVPMPQLRHWARMLALGDPRVVNPLRQQRRRIGKRNSIFWVIMQTMICIAPCPLPEENSEPFFRALRIMVCSDDPKEVVPAEEFLAAQWAAWEYGHICRGDCKVYEPNEPKDDKCKAPFDTNSDYHFQIVLERALNRLAAWWRQQRRGGLIRVYVIRNPPKDNNPLPFIASGAALGLSVDGIAKMITIENKNVTWTQNTWFIVACERIDDPMALSRTPFILEEHADPAFMPPDRTQIRVSDCWFFRAYVPANIDRKERFLGRYAPFTRVICAPLL